MSRGLIKIGRVQPHRLPLINYTRLTTNQGVTAMTNTNTDIKQIAEGKLYD
jgi:hypothetical protein